MNPWWTDLGLGVGPRGLTFAGHDVATLAETHGTPLYAYSRSRLRDGVAALRTALGATGHPYRIHYAMKANRHEGVLGVFRAERDVGIDACSPREVERALALGFTADEISATVTAPSDRDLDAYASAGVHLNLDARSALRRWGARVPRGTGVGLRIDPGPVTAYRADPRVGYGGTKFGLREADVDDAIAVAHGAGLVVDTLHVHMGWGLPYAAREKWLEVVTRIAGLARRLPDLRTINLGGGLGARRRPEDRPLLLSDVAPDLREHLPAGVAIACEPGTLLVDRAGVLVARVSQVEAKGDVTWVGIDAGSSMYMYAAYYGVPVEPIHVGRPQDPPVHTYSVAGFINEGIDVFVRGYRMPEVREGDLFAIAPAGAYGASMASDHCMRGVFAQVLID